MDSQNVPAQFVRERIVTAHDEFDCVDWDKQPALRGRSPVVEHPPAPPSPPAGEIETEVPSAMAVTEDKHGPTRCPKGTVAIARFTLRGLEHVSSLAELKEVLEARRRTPHLVPCGDLEDADRYYEIYLSEFTSNRGGGRVKIDVANPAVPSGSLSLGQMWLSDRHTCTEYTTDTETIESGWVKWPGENAPRFFTFYTADGYGSAFGTCSSNCRSCWNAATSSTVGGFFCDSGSNVRPLVLYSGGGNVTPGASFVDLGGGDFGYLDMQWLLSSSTGRWWLHVNGSFVGYYPDDTYDSGLENGYLYSTAGGEIDIIEGTKMGSGQWGNGANAAVVSKWWHADGFSSPYHYNTDVYYYGDGRIDSQWQITGTYSSGITSNLDSFGFGGPGPGWN